MSFARNGGSTARRTVCRVEYADHTSAMDRDDTAVQSWRRVHQTRTLADLAELTDDADVGYGE
jgi:hypothetical protein